VINIGRKYNPVRRRATKQILGAKRLITLLWLVAITARYLDTVRNALLHPFNKGADLDWAWIFLAIISAQITSIALWRTRALRVWMAAGAVLAAILIFRSGSAPAFARGVPVLLAAACWGQWLMERVKPEKLRTTESIVVAFTLGLVFLAFASIALALFGLLIGPAVWLLLGISILLHGRTAVWMARRAINAARSFECDREDALLVALMGLVFLLNLMWALVPEIQFDANNYHLAVARMYIEKGRIVDLPNFFHSYFFHLFDLPMALCLVTGGPIAAKLLPLVSGMLASVATYSLGAMLFGHKVGLRSSALLYTTAVVGWLSGTAYVDNGLMLFLTVAVLAFLNWHETGDRVWLAITALLVGGAAGIKLQAFYVIPGMVVAELWRFWRQLNWRRVCSYAAAVLVAVAIASPWYSIVYGFTANPVFPLYNRIFNSPLWGPENTTLNATQFGLGTSAGALLRLPFRMAFNTERFGESSPRGSLGIGILLLLPFGVFMAFRDRRSQALLVISLLALLAWAVTFQYSRYYVTFLPLILCLGVAACSEPLLLLVVIVGQILVSPVQYWNIPERFPIFTALGLETQTSFLARALPGYQSSLVLNKLLRPDERILGVEMEQVRFYVNGPLDSLTEALAPSPLQFISRQKPNEALACALELNRYKYILASQHSLEEAATGYPFLNRDFLRSYAERIYVEDGVSLFRLKACRTSGLY
jgi:Dolichyl-phosphate-mannose-protein mannosyltransferase